MDKYNPDGKCIKCGNGDIEDEHKQADSDYVVNMVRCFDSNATRSPERIVRTCKHCGFTWDEATLDSVEATSFKASDIGQLEIEVGDTVSRGENGLEFKVVWMSSQNTDMVMMAYKTDQPIESHKSLLTLISKGPSKPIEIYMGQAEISNQGRYWQAPLPPQGTPDGRYNVTLRPIGEDSQ